MQWLRDNMLPYYPLGVYKDVKAEGYANIAEAAAAKAAERRPRATRATPRAPGVSE